MYIHDRITIKSRVLQNTRSVGPELCSESFHSSDSEPKAPQHGECRASAERTLRQHMTNGPWVYRSASIETRDGVRERSSDYTSDHT
ncbi:hypothetical protein TNCV_2275791 [Trichonephila clavipes]|nr:hypothetical protein TNCV_2275791 [Trichonephila clavipes]